MQEKESFSWLAGFLLQPPVRVTVSPVVLLLSNLVMMSCLSPQTIDPTPTVARTAPVIEYSGVSPSLYVACVDQTTVASTHYSIEVLSTDGGPLTARWFINYDPSIPTTWSYLPGEIGPASAGLNRSIYTFNASDLGLSGSTPSTYTLEVVVATEFGTGSPTTTDQWPGRIVPSSEWAVSYKWVVSYPGMGSCP